MEEMFCKSLFDALPFDIYVVDLETHEILCVNRAVASRSDAIPGRKCYEAICGGSSPCPFCVTSPSFQQEDSSAENCSVFERFNPVCDRWFQVHEKVLTWQGNKKVKYHISIDTTELKETQNRLTEAHAELAIKNKELAVLSSPSVSRLRPPSRYLKKNGNIVRDHYVCHGDYSKRYHHFPYQQQVRTNNGYSKVKMRVGDSGKLSSFLKTQKRMKDYFRSMLCNPDITPDSTGFE